MIPLYDVFTMHSMRIFLIQSNNLYLSYLFRILLYNFLLLELLILSLRQAPEVLNRRLREGCDGFGGKSCRDERWLGSQFLLDQCNAHVPLLDYLMKNVSSQKFSVLKKNSDSKNKQKQVHFFKEKVNCFLTIRGKVAKVYLLEYIDLANSF